MSVRSEQPGLRKSSMRILRLLSLNDPSILLDRGYLLLTASLFFSLQLTWAAASCNQPGSTENPTPDQWTPIQLMIRGANQQETVTVISTTKQSFRADFAKDQRRGEVARVIEEANCCPGQPQLVAKPILCQVVTAFKPNSLDRGNVTIECPNIWRSDRVFTVLDDILRDVDSFTIRGVQDLDPNQVNDLQLSATFNQADKISNALKLDHIKTLHGAELETFNFGTFSRSHSNASRFSRGINATRRAN